MVTIVFSAGAEALTLHVEQRRAMEERLAFAPVNDFERGLHIGIAVNKRNRNYSGKCEGRVMKQANQDRGTLLLALVAGLSINGTFAALFSSIVPFSVFPIISLVLTVWLPHQRYLNRTMPVGLPGLVCLFYSRRTAVQHGSSCGEYSGYRL